MKKPMIFLLIYVQDILFSVVVGFTMLSMNFYVANFVLPRNALKFVNGWGSGLSNIILKDGNAKVIFPRILILLYEFENLAGKP